MTQMRKHKHGLVVFRRDLRLKDNTALSKASELCDALSLCFIFDPRQIEPHAYRSEFGLQFLFESLIDLQNQCRTIGAHLHFYYGRSDQVLEQLLRIGIDAVFVNQDYTPFARSRDQAIQAVCAHAGVAFYSNSDTLLHEPGTVYKADKTPYTVFTPFYKNASLLTVQKPQSHRKSVTYVSLPMLTSSMVRVVTIDQVKSEIHFVHHVNAAVIGGTMHAQKIIQNLTHFVDYSAQRDFAALDATTKLSAHLKFGTVSVREVFAAMQTASSPIALIRQLYWRDFFTHIAYHFPHVFNGAFVKKYDALQWSDVSEKFTRWCKGTTGFPIIDAGMRQLNTTGYMHNRVRMVVASFLTKDLHINYKEGERYFATKLVDYDPCVNNGSWQWAASTGCDAQPYFRVFNPWLQQAKFDPQCLYIKKYCPELSALSPAQIHNWHTVQEQTVSYPAPMLDHSVEKSIAIARFKDV